MDRPKAAASTAAGGTSSRSRTSSPASRTPAAGDGDPDMLLDEPMRRKCKMHARRQALSELDVVEDIIEGFSIASFKSLEDLEAFSNYDSGESSSTAGIVRHGPHTQLAEEGTSSAGATTSLADEDHVTAERAGVGDDVSCSPSSVTIVDLDAATDDERRPGDPDVDEGDRTTTLRVPTPSSWEKYRVVVSVGSTSTVSEQAADDRDVKVVVVADRDRLNDLLKDDVADRRNVKKPCSCGALSSDAKQRISEDTVTISATPPLSVKIENRSDSPSFLRASGDSNHLSSCSHGKESSSHSSSAKSLASTQSVRASSKSSTRRPDDACCPHGAVKPVKSRCASPRLVGVRKHQSRSRSRSPTRSHPAMSRSHHSRHSVDIKTECTTPTIHKKSTSSADRFTPHRPLSSAGSIPSSASSFPLFTPAAVPASYFSAIRPPFPGLDATNVPNPFHGVPSRNGLFAPPSVGLHPSLMSSSLMMGLPNQFGSQDALLGANQDVLSRLQQELNARFLQDRSLLPLGLPPVPFTLHTEMHQHQHLHHHQHVLTPGTYLPAPVAPPAAGPAGLFQPPMSEKFPTGNDLLLHSQNLAELAERDRLAKQQFAGLSSFPGVGMAQGLSSSLSFGQNLHPSGAFQPKAGNANLSSLNPASHLLLSLREQDNLTRNSSLSSVPKKRGRWCAAHVNVAWKIHHHKVNKALDPTASLRAGRDAGKPSSAGLFGPGQLLGLSANSQGDVRSSMHPQGAAGLLQRPGPYAGVDVGFGGLAPAGMEGTLFGLQRAMPSAALPHSTAGKTSGLRRTSPMPHSATSPSSHRAEVLRDGHRDSETRARHQASLHHSTTSSRDHFRPLHASSSAAHKTRSPDHGAARSRNRSRSRSPHYQQQSLRPPISVAREPDMHFGPPPGLRASDFGVRSDMAMLRSGLMPGALAPGHAFTSLMAQPKPPSAAARAVGAVPSERTLNHDARKLMQERERLSSLGSAAAFVPSPATSLPSHLLHTASTDPVLCDRLLSEQHDRMMLAAAAAEYSARPTRAIDPALHPELFASHSDNLLCSVGSVLAAQSALLRPTLGCPPTIKLPQTYGPIIDPALTSLNLPFR